MDYSELHKLIKLIPKKNWNDMFEQGKDRFISYPLENIKGEETNFYFPNQLIISDDQGNPTTLDVVSMRKRLLSDKKNKIKGPYSPYEEAWLEKSNSLGLPTPIREFPFPVYKEIWEKSLIETGLSKKSEKKHYLRSDFYYPSLGLVIEIDSLTYHLPIVDKFEANYRWNAFKIKTINILRDEYPENLEELIKDKSNYPSSKIIESYSLETIKFIAYSGFGLFKDLWKFLSIDPKFIQYFLNKKHSFLLKIKKRLFIEKKILNPEKLIIFIKSLTGGRITIRIIS